MEPLHLVVCLKTVLDPEAINSYALWGKLQTDASGTAFAAPGIMRILNGYDEQAIEAALRVREEGTECRISAIAAGGEESLAVLRRAVAMGVDDLLLIEDEEQPEADGFRTARLLAAAITSLPRTDLVLCGRQGSDFDQGTVPAAMAEYLNFAFVGMGAALRNTPDGLEVVRVTPFGPATVITRLPAVVTISNEFGPARYPTSRGMMAGRTARPTRLAAASLEEETKSPRVRLRRLEPTQVQSSCEFIDGSDSRAKAVALLSRLRAEGILE